MIELLVGILIGAVAVCLLLAGAVVIGRCIAYGERRDSQEPED